MMDFKLRNALRVLLLLIGFNPGPSLGQTIPQIERFTEVNGDFQNIKTVQQDDIGNLWIASDFHIEKYNSQESEFFNIFKGLPKNTGKINTIFIDSREDIWVGAQNGLLKYDPGKNLFLFINSDRTTTQGNIQRIAEGNKGELWLGARNGIWKYSGDKVVLLTFFPSEQSVHELLYIDKHIVFGTSKGLFFMEEDNNKYKKITLDGNREINVQSLLFTGEFYLVGTQENGLYKTFPNFQVTEKIYSLPYSSQKLPISGLSHDRSGNIYIATKGDGLLILNRDLKLVSQYIVQEDNDFSIADNTINGLFMDRHNTLWVSTESGQINSLNLRENNFEFLRHDPKKYSSLADNYTTALAEDTNGNLWIGNRQGLSIWNPKKDSWQHFKNLSFSKTHNIPDNIKDLKALGSHMWVATYNDGIYKVNISTHLRAHYSVDSKLKTELLKAKALLVDIRNNVWAGGEDGNLIKITINDQIESFPLKDIDALLQISSGVIIAGGKNGVFKIENSGKTITPIRKLSPNAEKLPYFTINAISELSTGEIVLATEGAGIIIFDFASDSFQVVNKASGLPSNRIQGLLVYQGDEIWAGTSKGLVNFKHEEANDIRIFDKEDGLLSPVFTRGSFANLDDKLAFGTFKGVSIFSPDKLKNEPRVVPNLIIGAIEVDSQNKASKKIKSIGSGGELNLEHDENSLKFNFYGIEPGIDRQINYSWKLEGYDDEWSLPGLQKEVNYANLAPGKYTFLIKAGYRNGTWRSTQEIPVTINRPWWRSTTAIIAFLVGGILLALTLVVFLERTVKNRLKNSRLQVIKKFESELGTPLPSLLGSLENMSKGTELLNRDYLGKIAILLRHLLGPFLQIPPEEKPQQSEKMEMRVEDEVMQPIVSERKKILIADSDLEQSKIIASFLRQLGEVYEANTSQEAIKLIDKRNFDVIIASLNIQGMDGLEFYKVLRNNPALSRTPLFLIQTDKDNLPLTMVDKLLFFINNPVEINALMEMIAEKLEVSLAVPYTNTLLSARNSKLFKEVRKEDPYRDLKQYIIQNITRFSFTPRELAGVMGITTVSLDSRLRESFGLSPEEFVVKIKLEFARNLILEGNSDLTEIARLSGFRNKDMFHASYKKYFGFLPGTVNKK